MSDLGMLFKVYLVVQVMLHLVFPIAVFGVWMIERLR
jgi:hypothetical protein